MIPGTIQPARFLTDTGQIRPGVRQVINVPNPAAGADWTYTVPGGSMVKILVGQCTLTTGSDGGSEVPNFTLTSAGVPVWAYGGFEPPEASSSLIFGFGSAQPSFNGGGPAGGVFFALPDLVLSSQDTFGPTTAALQADDQWSAINLLVDNYYFTDEQLSTLEVQKQAAELVYVQQLEQQLSRQ